MKFHNQITIYKIVSDENEILLDLVKIYELMLMYYNYKLR